MAGMVGGGLPSSRWPSLGDQVTAVGQQGSRGEHRLLLCYFIMILLPPPLLSYLLSYYTLHTAHSF